MSDQVGWIKIHRQLLDNPIMTGNMLALWVVILMTATHKERDVLFKGERITTKSGQLLTGRKFLSMKSGVSESTVQRFLKKLESEHQIEQQISNKNRLITILNWSKYQGDEHQVEQQVNNKRTTSEQQVNTYKNVKNTKNIKKDTTDNGNDNEDERKEIVVYFNEVCTTQLKPTSSKMVQLSNRLKIYSAEEIKQAIIKRTKLPWYAGENDDGRLWYRDWDSLFRNDEKIEAILNHEVKAEKTTSERIIESAEKALK